MAKKKKITVEELKAELIAVIEGVIADANRVTDDDSARRLDHAMQTYDIRRFGLQRKLDRNCDEDLVYEASSLVEEAQNWVNAAEGTFNRLLFAEDDDTTLEERIRPQLPQTRMALTCAREALLAIPTETDEE